MQIGWVSGDLMMASKIKQLMAARGWGMEFQSSVGERVQWRTSPGLVVVDLQTSGCQIESWLSSLRESVPTAKVLAFAGHTMADSLKRAREAGYDRVVTRGQLEISVLELAEALAAE